MFHKVIIRYRKIHKIHKSAFLPCLKTNQTTVTSKCNSMNTSQSTLFDFLASKAILSLRHLEIPPTCAHWIREKDYYLIRNQSTIRLKPLIRFPYINLFICLYSILLVQNKHTHAHTLSIFIIKTIQCARNYFYHRELILIWYIYCHTNNVDNRVSRKRYSRIILDTPCRICMTVTDRIPNYFDSSSGKYMTNRYLLISKTVVINLPYNAIVKVIKVTFLCTK